VQWNWKSSIISIIARIGIDQFELKISSSFSFICVIFKNSWTSSRLMNSKKKHSKSKSSILTDQINELTNSAPTQLDDEDEYDDGTRATDLLGGQNDYEALEDQVPTPSILRMSAEMDLVGNEYKGKPVSRKDLGHFNESQEVSDEEGSGDDDEDENDKDSERNDAAPEDDASSDVEEDDEISKTRVSTESNSSETEDSEDSIQEAQTLDDELAQLEQEDMDNEIQLAKFNQQDFKKSAAAKVQKSWWDNFFQTRILLQRLTNSANRLPVAETYPLFAKNTDAETLPNVTKTISAVLKNLLKIQHLQQSQHEKIESSNKGTNLPTEEDEIWERINGGYNRYKTYWEPTLERWHKKTQLSLPGAGGKGNRTAKYKVLNQGFWTQVEAVLADRQRGKRKLHPSVPDNWDNETSKPLGRGALLKASSSKDAETSEEETDDSSDEEKEEERQTRRENEDLDLQCFDDIEFYQQQLKEFIANSNELSFFNGEQLPVAKKKKLRKVDQKASKARKLKFTVHPKLENFMYPQPFENVPMNIDELYSSLFGQRPGFD